MGNSFDIFQFEIIIALPELDMWLHLQMEKC